MSQRNQLGKRRLFADTDHLELAEVDAQQGGCLWRDRVAEVVDSDTVNGAHFAQFRAAGSDQLRQLIAADLDQLAAGDERLLGGGHGGQRQQRGRSQVVDDHRRFGPGQLLQQQLQLPRQPRLEMQAVMLLKKKMSSTLFFLLLVIKKFK